MEAIKIYEQEQKKKEIENKISEFLLLIDDNRSHLDREVASQEDLDNLYESIYKHLDNAHSESLKLTKI